MTIRFIAEIGSNHNQSWDRCEGLIEAAHNVGCWGVKFQLFKADRLYAPEFTEQIQINRKRELPEGWLPSIQKICKSLKIRFGCTPFHPEDVSLLAEYVDWLKISSFDIRREDLIMACMKTQKPLTISVGLASDEEIIRLKEMADRAGHMEYMTLLHSISEYPTPLGHCHMREGLGRIMRLAIMGKIDVPILGYSDHTAKPEAIYSAIRYGAEVIECHFDDYIIDSLNTMTWTGSESVHNHCWYPEQLANVIAMVQNIETASGKGIMETGFGDGYDVWMADPEDGMRPLKRYRKELLQCKS